MSRGTKREGWFESSGILLMLLQISAPFITATVDIEVRCEMAEGIERNFSVRRLGIQQKLYG